VLAGEAVLSGGDWPGNYQYWISRDNAEAHAKKRIESGLLDIRVIEVDPPLHSNMFPTRKLPDMTASQDLEPIYIGPRGGRYRYEQTRDGRTYRKYF